MARLRPDLRRLPLDLPGAAAPVGLTRLAGAATPPAVAAFDAELTRLCAP